jgi:NADH-quinone oxidoreductase subunit F
MPPNHEQLPAPCQAACPAGIDVPSYVALIAHGRYREAVNLIREDNPFPWVCGLVCPHPCESSCVKGYQDAPIAIRALKGFVASTVEKMEDELVFHPPERYRGRVAVIGSGPAGLSAACFLGRLEYQVTVFEALPVAGGMMAVGIPAYRLPRNALAKEIRYVENHGVEIRLNSPIGGDKTLASLREEGYQSIFVGTGAHRSNTMRIEGETDFSQVVSATEFLKSQQIGHRERLGQRVVVIGGGNSAFDAARTSIRLGSTDVHVVYRRTRQEMPALEEEIVQAEEEGVRIHYLTLPTRILGDGILVTGIECLQAELGAADRTGRRRPVPKAGSEFTIPADGVIVAIGQAPDMGWLNAAEGVELTKWGNPVIHPHSLQTSVPDVFAGGDVVLGPATVIEAVAMGKQAAVSIDRYLSGRPLPDAPDLCVPRMRVETVKLEARDKVRIPPAPIPLLAVEERVQGFELIEAEWEDDRARNEARRCLRCDICIGCGECARICRTKVEVDALRFVDAGGDRVVIADMLRPQDKCIGCGSCANICPTGAMQIVDEGSTRKLVKCGATLARLEMVQCSSCGALFTTKRMVEYLKRVVDADRKKELARMHCPDCARVTYADHLAMKHL